MPNLISIGFIWFIYLDYNNVHNIKFSVTPYFLLFFYSIRVFYHWFFYSLWKSTLFAIVEQKLKSYLRFGRKYIDIFPLSQISLRMFDVYFLFIF